MCTDKYQWFLMKLQGDFHNITPNVKSWNIDLYILQHNFIFNDCNSKWRCSLLADQKHRNVLSEIFSTFMLKFSLILSYPNDLLHSKKKQNRNFVLNNTVPLLDSLFWYHIVYLTPIGTSSKCGVLWPKVYDIALPEM